VLDDDDGIGWRSGRRVGADAQVGVTESTFRMARGVPVIETVASEAQLEELLPLMRLYCDFYNVAPDDESLLTLSRALIADPACEGVQLLARWHDEAIGFATVFWSWSTTNAGRIGVMNDLFVLDKARGIGAGAALIDACARLCRERGALRLVWQTAPDNHHAQALYERIGAVRETWIDYWIDTSRRERS
jgi:GNAT superfamily N-acetyltransferase